MREKYKELLDTIQVLRKGSDTTVSQMVEEYQNSINTYEGLSRAIARKKSIII